MALNDSPHHPARDKGLFTKKSPSALFGPLTLGGKRSHYM